MIMNFRIINNTSDKPYNRLLILPSGIYATYKNAVGRKDKLDIVYIDADDSGLVTRPLPLFVQLFSGKRYDLEGSVFFKFYLTDGAHIDILTGDMIEMKQLVKLAGEYNPH